MIGLEIDGRVEGAGEGFKDYMETPCKHKFHEHCLRNWMGRKKECPTCRRGLPPIDIEEMDEMDTDDEY